MLGPIKRSCHTYAMFQLLLTALLRSFLLFVYCLCEERYVCNLVCAIRTVIRTWFTKPSCVLYKFVIIHMCLHYYCLFCSTFVAGWLLNVHIFCTLNLNVVNSEFHITAMLSCAICLCVCIHNYKCLSPKPCGRFKRTILKSSGMTDEM
jgi:hypothetical protein